MRRSYSMSAPGSAGVGLEQCPRALRFGAPSRAECSIAIVLQSVNKVVSKMLRSFIL